MTLSNRHTSSLCFGFTCILAASLVATASAQTAAKKVIRGESIDDTPPAATAPAADAATNAAPTPVKVIAHSPPPPSATSIPATTPITSMPTITKDGVQVVDFTKLAGFDYIVPDMPDTNQVYGKDASDKQIPTDVRSLDKKKVSITGYLMPLKEEDGKSTEFLLMRTQSSCCYGIPPAITELITVKAAGKGVPTIMDDLVEIEGTLKVGTTREDGYIVGVYQMDEGKYMGRADR